jgi:hypothetical protein
MNLKKISLHGLLMTGDVGAGFEGIGGGIYCTAGVLGYPGCAIGGAG